MIIENDIQDVGAPKTRVEAADAETYPVSDEPSAASPFGDSREWVPDYDDFEKQVIEKTDWPFKCLGYDHGQYYFLAQTSNQILHFPAAALNKANLRALAPLDWWYQFYPKKDLEDKVIGIKWDNAVDDILKLAHKSGVFNPDDRQRGAGIWAEKHGPVVHCGNKLIYQNGEFNAFDFDSHFIYEASPERFRLANKGLSNAESKLLYEICTRPSWKDPKSGKILAGWIVASIVGGCLKWRPHIWIMGALGSGKSFMINDVLEKVFGGVGCFLGAGSTEAGVRQSLRHDCLPVIMDEMDGESMKDNEIIQSIITMSRRSSSGQRMAKGTAEGIAQSFTLQSSFCFASINHSIAQGADESRISILEMEPDARPGAIEKFAELDALAKKTLTPEYTRRLLRRIVDDLPCILKNIQTFMTAIRKEFGNARSAQQLSPLLAGVYSLIQGGFINPEVAQKWVKENDFKPYTATDAQKDCAKAFDYLMTTRIKVISAHKSFDTQIGMAIAVAIGAEDAGYLPVEARMALEAIDIKVREYIWIRRPSQHINRIFKNTPWAVSWPKTLTLNSFITASVNVQRIGTGLSKVLIIDPEEFRQEYQLNLADHPPITV